MEDAILYLAIFEIIFNTCFYPVCMNVYNIYVKVRGQLVVVYYPL